MAEEVLIETRKRGFFGWVFLLVFLAWNGLMVLWLGGYSMHSSSVVEQASSEAARAGATIGTGLGVMMILFVWVAGAVVTGLLALLTRGGKTVIVRKG